MSREPRHRVLNVDDYDAGRYARTQMLRQAGFEVSEAATGADALRMTAGEQPDVVLLDVNLADVDGLEVCRRLKSDPATAQIPVLHISATFVGAGYRALALEGGADAYLTEPVEPPVLVATVNALLRMRRAEAALRAAARQWQGTFDAIADGVALLNVTGTILRVNAAFPRLLGAPLEDVVGHRIADVWSVSPARSVAPFIRMLETLHRETTEVPLGERWLRMTADPIIEAGAIVGAVYIVSDITERKRIEEELAGLLAREQAARREAEAANRAKDEFLAIVSHELRAPLNVMLGWSRMLRGGLLDETARRHALDTIERNIKVQVQLIDDLLDVSRIVTGNLRLDVRPTDLAAVIEAAAESARPAANAKSIALRRSLEPLAPILADPGRLQQVVWNLITNAVKFTPPGGSVAVRLERLDAEVRIVVTDTGQGIDEALLPYVFDRFWQAEGGSTRRHGGLGLGLAIVRHLVEAHGGSVAAASAGPGRGATFTVTLPIWMSGPALGLPAERSMAGGVLPRLDGVQVLVVDDEMDVRKLIGAVLEQCGASVCAVGSTAEALARGFAPRPPDVIVSDIAMPDADGFDLIRLVRGRSPEQGGQIPAIALTAYTRGQDVERVLAAGYQLHIGKPVEPEALARAVARLATRS